MSDFDSGIIDVEENELSEAGSLSGNAMPLEGARRISVNTIGLTPEEAKLAVAAAVAKQRERDRQPAPGRAAPLAVVLPWPPSVNGYWRAFRSRIILSAKGRKYKQDASDALAEQAPGVHLGRGRMRVRLVLHPPTRRECDVDNYAKATLDALTAAGIWADDAQVDELTITRGPIVKKGCVEVSVEVIHEQEAAAPASAGKRAGKKGAVRAAKKGA